MVLVGAFRVVEEGDRPRRNVDMNVDTAGLAARATTGSLNQG
jgi:hypothetical protein